MSHSLCAHAHSSRTSRASPSSASRPRNCSSRTVPATTPPSRKSSDSNGSPDPAKFALADAQRVLARAYGFSSWTKLKQHVEGVNARGASARPSNAGDVATVRRLAKARPDLVQVERGRSSRGLPLHVAVLNRDAEMTRVLMELGADARAGHLAASRRDDGVHHRPRPRVRRDRGDHRAARKTTPRATQPRGRRPPARRSMRCGRRSPRAAPRRPSP